MSESTLTLGYPDYAALIGYYLGYGRTSGNWTPDQQSDIDDCINAGLRQFYYPPTPLNQVNHEWSFLRPITTLPIFSSLSISGATWLASVATFTTTQQIPTGSTVTVAGVTPTGYNGTYVVTGSTATTFTAALTSNPGAFSVAGTVACNDYGLPDDFGGIDGDFTYATADLARNTIAVISEAVIRAYRQNSSTITGRPRFASVTPIANTGLTGQRFYASFWPNVNAAYTPSYRYKSLAPKITASLPYPLGGSVHSDTILESMLHKAEILKNDGEDVHAANFMKRLAASIQHDRRLMAPEFYGYNGDKSDDSNQPRFSRTTNVTVNGVTY